MRGAPQSGFSTLIRRIIRAAPRLLAGIPLMVGTRTGSEIRQPLGYVIVGGLLVSQMLTLFTTPIVYIYMDRLSGWLSRRSRAQSSDRAETSKPQERSGACRAAMV
jgi:hydrophobic/amphiphilic exporter-1 (mainly G- bacteria), HAE1 family